MTEGNVLCADNLDVLRRHVKAESVDLVYRNRIAALERVVAGADALRQET